ncbi:hypothetical protein NW795_25825 [Escherichia coli]|nr:hypothetical protein [Escherichia coli]
MAARHRHRAASGVGQEQVRQGLATRYAGQVEMPGEAFDAGGLAAE